jgi:hypothetical protein
MRSAQIALAASLTLLLIAVGLTLLHSPSSVAATNKLTNQPQQTLATSRASTSYCQSDETLPQGTSAIRMSLSASIGPHLSVRVSSDGHTVTGGQQGSGWTGWVVTVPVKPIARAVSGTTVCVTFRARNETVVLLGRSSHVATGLSAGGRGLPGRMAIEYLRPGDRSWGSLASTIARNIGFGRAASGSWIVFFAIALMVGVAALTSRFVLLELR